MEPTRNCTLIVGRSTTIIPRIVGRDGELTTHNTGEVCSSQRNPFEVTRAATSLP
jgi:hypothetical protein